jgi:hypothetical protein
MQVVKESDKLRATENKATQFHKVSTSASGGMLIEDPNQDMSFMPDPIINL